MTTQFTVDFRYSGRFAGNPGYAFYGVLCSRFTSETANLLHEQDSLLLHQYVVFSNTQQSDKWYIYCYDDKITNEVKQALKNDLLTVKNIPIQLQNINESILPEGEKLSQTAEQLFGDARVYQMVFHSAVVFKQKGMNVNMPTVRLIYQSMLSRWSHLTGNCKADDDVMDALLKGTHISTYKLESSYYPMKGGSVSGFRGRLTLSLRLAEPLRIFVRDLLLYSERTGIGAKTALGMGGNTVSVVSQ
jgi:CRISPR-associated endoribonuclease Cas6